MKSLRIAILAKIDSPTITNELVPVLEGRGHIVSIIDMSVLPLVDFLKNPQVEALLNMDIIYFRSGLSPDLSSMLEIYLRSQNKTLINLHFATHPFANTKSYETIIAQENGFVVPVTLYRTSLSYEEIKPVLGETFVAKPNSGARGENVQLISNENEWDELQKNDTSEYIYQSLIPHDFEYRVHILGDKAVAMYKRLPPVGDFRSNVSLGGKMEQVEDDARQTLITLSAKIASIFHFEIMAVDFMFNSQTGEYVFTEINLNPGWEISDKLATGLDLSSATADYFEKIAIINSAYEKTPV